jgi:Kef-type K+ transport system membrane component KefB
MADLVTHSVFGEVAALLMLASVVGFAAVLLRQPLIVGFIVVGLAAGPSGLDIVRSSDQIDLLSELGVAVLLFLVGIRLDVNLVRSLGAVSLMTGLGQVLFTSVFGFAIGLALGLGTVASLYVAVALTFSSTIIIVKLLSDKREIDSLHGQVALGFLIVQDLVVVLAMIVLSAIGIGAAGDSAGIDVLVVTASGALLLALVVVFIKYLADPLTERLARAPELLITFAIAQAAMFAAIGDLIGLGKEIGGLLAGVSLASTRFRDTIAARLAPVRDFLLLFFFIALGAGLDLTHLGGNASAAVVFSTFVLVGNPLIVLVIMGAMGFRKRTGFLAGLTVAQISEFSLIFAAMGVALGHIGHDVLGLVTLVGLATIAASTYMITYSHRLYALCEPVLGVFERSGTPREPDEGTRYVTRSYDFVLFGLGRFGTAIAGRLRRAGARVLGIDFNPAAIRRCRRLGFDVEYGDATDPEFLAGLPLASTRWAVSTIPAHLPGVTHDDPPRVTVQALRASGFTGRIAITSHHDPEAVASLGVDLVLEPFQDAADRAAELLLGESLPERVSIEGEDDAVPEA